jgi:NTE family protein
MSCVTAFVLAGGGSLGAVEVGMLQALLAHGLRPDFVVGASAGAINAAYFAGDPTQAGVDRLAALWRGLSRREVMPMGWRELLQLLRGGHNLLRADGLRRLLERHLTYDRIEQAALPLHVVATDMHDGSEVLLSRGKVVDAVLASSAIPGVFPPVRMAGRELVDGGVCNNTPISSAVQLGAQRVVVLPTGFACAPRRVPDGAVGRALHALSLLVARQLAYDIERYGRALQLHVVPPLCPVDVSPYDYSAAGTLIERAARTTATWLSGGGLERTGELPHELPVHRHAEPQRHRRDAFVMVG